MRILVPKRIIEEDIITEKNHKIKGFRKSKIMLAIAKIFTPSHKQMENEQNMKEISSYEWKSDLSNNYRDYLDYLEDENIIVCDHHYIEGEKSMSYSIMPDWNSTPTIHEIEDWTLLKNYMKRKLANSNTSCPHLDRWVTNPSLTLSISSDKYLENLNLLKNNLSNRQLAYDLWTLIKFEEQNHTAKRDQTSGRYHSIVTSTSRRIRPYFRFDGEPLVELDIKNCQPFCSLLLLNPDFYVSRLENSKINLSKIAKLPFFSYSTNLNKSITPPTLIPSIKIQAILKLTENKDVEFYKFVVLEGKLYEWIQTIVETKLNMKLNRQQIKKAFFYVLYSGRKAVGSPSNEPYFLEIKKLLYSLLPNVFAIFNQFKKTDYKTLSILLQRIESYLIIDLITRSIPHEIPLYTIHDSILTTPKYAIYIQEKLIEDIAIYTGYKPVVVIKD